MFLCKRQIDIHARFGVPRIAFLSFTITVIAFLISYEIMYYFVNTPLSDRHFIILLIIVALMYPIHKALHLLFFLPYVNSFRIHKLNKKRWLPYFNTYVSTPVHKIYFCINLILPFILITIFFIFLKKKINDFRPSFIFVRMYFCA